MTAAKKLPARRASDMAARNQLAWTVAGLALLALVVIMRVVFPPPALAGQAAAGPLPVAASKAGPDAASAPANPLPVPGATTGPGLAGAQGPGITTRPDDVTEMEWRVLQGVAAQSRDPSRTLAALVAKLRFSKQLELFRSGSAAAPRADLAAQLLADLPARVAAGDMARDEALRLLPALVGPLEPDPASRAARVRREAARLPGQALQAVP